MATVDPAKAAARRRAQRANAKAMKGKGSNPISGMAKAAAKTVATRNGPKASETEHLSTQQFSGGSHHAPSAQGASKNARGSETSLSRGKHSDSMTSGRHHAEPSSVSVKKNATGSMDARSTGKHSSSGHRGGYDRVKDVARAYKDRVGTGIVGKHRKPGA